MSIRIGKFLSFFLNVSFFKYLKICIFAFIKFLIFYCFQQSLFKDIFKYTSDKKVKSYLFKSIYILVPFFSFLKKRSLTKNELRQIFYVSSITPIIDDYLDKYHLSKAKLLDILFNNYDDIDIEDVNIRRIVYLLQEFKKIIDIEAIKNIVNKIIELQYNQYQSIDSEDFEKIKKITFDKGGNSLILFALILNLNDNEQLKVTYYFGALLQLMDDIFDVYYDNRNNCPTLITKYLGNKSIVFDEINNILMELTFSIERLNLKNQKILNNLLTLLLVPSCMYLINISSVKDEKWIKWNIKYIVLLFKTILYRKKYYVFC